MLQESEGVKIKSNYLKIDQEESYMFRLLFYSINNYSIFNFQKLNPY